MAVKDSGTLQKQMEAVVSEHHKHFSDRELGIAQAMIEEFAEHRIPRLINLESELISGKLITDFDIMFLNECIEMSKDGPAFAERHSEYKELISQVAALYHRITELALRNEESE